MATELSEDLFDLLKIKNKEFEGKNLETRRIGFEKAFEAWPQRAKDRAEAGFKCQCLFFELKPGEFEENDIKKFKGIAEEYSNRFRAKGFKTNWFIAIEAQYRGQFYMNVSWE